MRIKVRIKETLYDVRHRYASYIHIPPYNDYEGEIAPRPKWCTEEQFALTTGDADAPIRILEKDSIICGWIMPDRVRDNTRRYVCIPGKTGKHHTVYLSDDGLRFTCDCLGFGYRRRCSHVEEVEAA